MTVAGEHSPELACEILVFTKAETAAKGRRFESVQYVKAAAAVRLKTLERWDLAELSGSSESSGTSVLEGRHVFSGGHDSMSFTVIFKNFEHHVFSVTRTIITFLKYEMFFKALRCLISKDSLCFQQIY